MATIANQLQSFPNVPRQASELETTQHFKQPLVIHGKHIKNPFLIPALDQTSHFTNEKAEMNFLQIM